MRLTGVRFHVLFVRDLFQINLSGLAAHMGIEVQVFLSFIMFSEVMVQMYFPHNKAHWFFRWTINYVHVMFKLMSYKADQTTM